MSASLAECCFNKIQNLCYSTCILNITCILLDFIFELSIDMTCFAVHSTVTPHSNDVALT
jgi:hypothetical protein